MIMKRAKTRWMRSHLSHIEISLGKVFQFKSYYILLILFSIPGTYVEPFHNGHLRKISNCSLEEKGFPKEEAVDRDST